jgi:hypothetical protein
VFGALEAADPNGMHFASSGAVLGTLRSGGALIAERFLSIDRDAFVDGDVLGRIDVNGTLHAPSNAAIGPAVGAGALVSEPVTVTPPCGCAAGSALDIASEIAARASANDDARIGITADELAGGSGPAALDLPCGNYYLSALSAPSELELRVHGHAALFVAGAVTLASGLRVVIDPGASLDFVIGGDFTASGEVGAADASGLRMWLQGNTLHLAGATLSALVYAPEANLIADGDVSAIGALFVAAISAPGDVSVRFDARALVAGDECNAPPQSPIR